MHDRVCYILMAAFSVIEIVVQNTFLVTVFILALSITCLPTYVAELSSINTHVGLCASALSVPIVSSFGSPLM